MARKKLTLPRCMWFKYILPPLAAMAMIAGYILGWHSPVPDRAVFNVNRGDSITAVANRLQAGKLINSSYLFKTVIRGMGGRVQMGEYDIPAGASLWRIARMISHGDIATVTIVIPEGLTIIQIKNLLLASASLSGAVECAAGNTAPVCSLRDGMVFPDTYRVAKGTARLALLDLARKKMAGIERAWHSGGGRAPMPLKTWNDVITLASIVQKETPRADEMPIVASVYLNRLRKNMRLQADPTVVYAITAGLGDMRGAALLRGHLKVDSPYNTYTHNGLPPAPIANVGDAAIRAVLRPADTNYLFFVADGQGGHRFARSYDEHVKNHADWREIKKSKNKN